MPRGKLQHELIGTTRRGAARAGHAARNGDPCPQPHHALASPARRVHEVERLKSERAFFAAAAGNCSEEALEAARWLASHWIRDFVSNGGNSRFARSQSAASFTVAKRDGRLASQARSTLAGGGTTLRDHAFARIHGSITGDRQELGLYRIPEAPALRSYQGNIMNQPSIFDPRLWAHRISMHAMYYKIAIEQATRYHERDSEHSELEMDMANAEELSDISRRLNQCYEERAQSAVIAITFAGMTLEAFFYDYAAGRLGDSVITKRRDRLNLPSKFLEYPRLVCGKSPDKSAAAYTSLEKLVRLRNALVHFKSLPFGVQELHKASDFHDQLHERLRIGVDGAIESVHLVLTELGALHGDGSLFDLRLKWSVGQT